MVDVSKCLKFSLGDSNRITFVGLIRWNNIPESSKPAIQVVAKLLDLQIISGTRVPTHSNDSFGVSQPQDYYCVQENLRQKENYDRLVTAQPYSFSFN